MTKPFNIKPPKGLEEYIIARADEKYLIFNYKKNVGRCTGCGKYSKLDEIAPRHNEKNICPKCGKTVIAKEERYGRKNITEYGRVLWFKKAKGVTFAELDEYIIDYREMVPEVSLWPSAQYRFSQKEQAYYKHIPEWYWNPEYWEKRKNIKLPEPSVGMFGGWYNIPKYQKTYTHASYLTGIGTDLRYANLIKWGKSDPYTLIGYIHNFLKYQSIELLDKAGFEAVVREKATGMGCRAINWKATDLRKILKLSRKELREFKEEKGGMRQLERRAQYLKRGIHIKFSQISKLPYYREEATLGKIEKYMKIEKALTYLENQEDLTLQDYADYLDECEMLGIDLRKKRNIFPADLKEAHKQSSSSVKIQKDEIIEKNFREKTEEIYSHGTWEDGGYMIKAARSPEELAKESKELGHCVRTYGEKVARGQCAILFVRERTKPDEPFFALELSPKHQIIQCRGKYNCGMPEEVKAFVEKWHKEIVLKKEKKKGEAASAA